MQLIYDEVLNVEVIVDTTVGPTGPPGPSQASYQHSQPSAVTPWIVNHNLGFKPNTMAYSVGGLMMWANVQHIDTNQLYIYFDSPTAGYATCS